MKKQRINYTLTERQQNQLTDHHRQEAKHSVMERDYVEIQQRHNGLPSYAMKPRAAQYIDITY